MRSYHHHCQHLLNGPVKVVSKKPVFRTSALFPALKREGINTRILFMGYWFIKRKISEITSVVTLRSQKGELLHRTSQTIRDSKAYSIEVNALLEAIEHPSGEPFTGSIELEFFSGTDMVFPFPAVVINYYGPEFSTVVHSAQRVYNDYEDMRENSESTVPESGFNLYADGDKEPIISMINGCEAVDGCEVQMEFFNAKQERLSHTELIDTLAPYETLLLQPKQLVPSLEHFFDGEVGACKVKFNLSWVYPRLVAGNIQHSLSALSVTHTYYDCTDAATDGDYWHPMQEGWHAATLMIPVSIFDDQITNAYFYPILSPCTLAIDVEFYSDSGVLVGTKKDALMMKAPLKEYARINFRSLCEELGLVSGTPLGARIIARPVGSDRIPARIKIGLDLGENENDLPCNICTNLQPFKPELESKPRCFRWAPLLADEQGACAWFLNTSCATEYTRTAEVNIIFHREEDTEMLERRVVIPPNGFFVLHIDEELKTFFGGRPGWFSATSTTPHLQTYYFLQHPSGVVGGDHGF